MLLYICDDTSWFIFKKNFINCIFTFRFLCPSLTQEQSLNTLEVLPFKAPLGHFKCWSHFHVFISFPDIVLGSHTCHTDIYTVHLTNHAVNFNGTSRLLQSWISFHKCHGKYWFLVQCFHMLMLWLQMPFKLPQRHHRINIFLLFLLLSCILFGLFWYAIVFDFHAV